ncbi:MAG: GNAT family protein [Candidatus Eisenbacteria bacterium]
MITGEKVRLRAYREDDLKNNVAWLNNPTVTRYLLNMRPWSVVEEKAWLDRVMRNEDPNSATFVVETNDGEYVGSAGLMHIDHRNRTAEAGIVIGRPEEWGRGQGTDAMKTLLKHGFEELNLHRIALRVYTFNERAIRSYQKLGFVEEGRLRQAMFRHGAWHDVILMAILADEYFARHGRTADGEVLDASQGRP